MLNEVRAWCKPYSKTPWKLLIRQLPIPETVLLHIWLRISRATQNIKSEWTSGLWAMPYAQSNSNTFMTLTVTKRLIFSIPNALSAYMDNQIVIAIWFLSTFNFYLNARQIFLVRFMSVSEFLNSPFLLENQENCEDSRWKMIKWQKGLWHIYGD